MKSNRSIFEKLDSIAADLENGNISRIVAARMLRAAIAEAKPVAKRRGRPVGSRTKAETPAMTRTREFFSLLDKGSTLIAAQKEVAKKWSGIDAKTISTDVRRHGRRVLDNEWANLHFKIGKNFIEKHQDIAESLIYPVREFYPRLAERVRNLGNEVAADEILKMPPLENSREFFEFVGEWILNQSKSIRNSGDS